MMDVSVVICSYNRLWCLPRAVASCRITRCKTEIIVIDDGSTDGTWEWLQQQPDIRSFYQLNQGQTYAINRGVAEATGKYIRFLDSDDFLCDGTIDKQFDVAARTHAELVYSRVNNYIEETGEIIDFPEIVPWDDFLEVQLSNSYGSHFLGMLFLTTWVKKVPRRPEFALREDRIFILEYGLLEPKIEFVEGCAGYWVQHRQQMQRNYNGLISQVTNWQHFKGFTFIINRLEAQGKLNENRRKAAFTVLWPLARWTAKSFIPDAEEILNYIYSLDPRYNIPEKGLIGIFYRFCGFRTTERLLKIRRFFKYGL